MLPKMSGKVKEKSGFIKGETAKDSALAKVVKSNQTISANKKTASDSASADIDADDRTGRVLLASSLVELISPVLTSSTRTSVKSQETYAFGGAVMLIERACTAHQPLVWKSSGSSRPLAATGSLATRGVKEYVGGSWPMSCVSEFHFPPLRI